MWSIFGCGGKKKATSNEVGIWLKKNIPQQFEIIKKSGSWFSYCDTKLGQGRDAVKALIKDNPELMDELEQKIKELIKINNN